MAPSAKVENPGVWRAHYGEQGAEAHVYRWCGDLERIPMPAK